MNGNESEFRVEANIISANLRENRGSCRCLNSTFDKTVPRGNFFSHCC